MLLSFPFCSLSLFVLFSLLSLLFLFSSLVYSYCRLYSMFFVLLWRKHCFHTRIFFRSAPMWEWRISLTLFLTRLPTCPWLKLVFFSLRILIPPNNFFTSFMPSNDFYLSILSMWCDTCSYPYKQPASSQHLTDAHSHKRKQVTYTKIV